MNETLLRKILIVMLVVFIVIALAGVVVAGVGEDFGLILIIIGVAAIFPVLGELSRQDRAASRGKKTEEESRESAADNN